jgi:hypothetical protein
MIGKTPRRWPSAKAQSEISEPNPYRARHRPRSAPRRGRWVRATIRCPTVGTVTGVEHPAPRANGTADRFRSVRVRIVLPAGGPAVRGPASPLTGSGVPAAAASIIPLRIGEARRGAGATHSRLALSPSGSGFSPPYDISYRGVKLPRVSAALGGSELRRGTDLPQVGADRSLARTAIRILEGKV